jgi:hypothetical protein
LPRKTTEKFYKEVYDLVGEEYIFSGEYKNNRIKLRCKHTIPECNYEWEISPNNFINNGHRCPKCAGNIKKTTQQFKQEVFELVGNEYIVLWGISKYKNTYTILS